MAKVENDLDIYYAVENANKYSKTRKWTCSNFEKT